MTIQVKCDECGKLEDISEIEKWYAWKEKEKELHYCTLKCYKKFVANLKEKEEK